MNKQEKQDNDLLSRYINSDMREKAPEGFTTKVMESVGLEMDLVKNNSLSGKRSIVPFISGFITLILILAAFLIPEKENGPLALPAFQFLKNMKITLPEFSFDSLLKLQIPAIIIYVLIGIFILSLFDRALSGVFRRDGSPKSFKSNV